MTKTLAAVILAVALTGCAAAPDDEAEVLSLHDAVTRLTVSPNDATNCVLPFEMRSVANGLYVTAELNNPSVDYAELRAAASVASTWEHFLLCNNSDGTFSLKSQANGLFVSTDVDINAGQFEYMLQARASSVGSWEKYWLVNYGPYYTLQSVGNGRYVSTRLNNNNMLSAWASTPSGWEQFD